MDNLERRLRDLGESVEKKLADTSVVPRPDVLRRARARRSGSVVGTALLTVGVLAAGFSGVSAMVGRSFPTEDPSILSAAAQTTELQGTARTRFEMEMEFGFGGRSMNATTSGEGEIDFGKNRSYLLADMTVGGTSHTLEVVQDDLITYTKGAPGTEGWVTTEVLTRGGFGNQNIRPGEYLDYLNDVSERVEVLGEEMLDGASVTRYRAEIDPELVNEELPAETTEMLGDFELDYAPFEVWIDGQGRVRQMSFGFIMDGETAGESFSSSISFTSSFYDFGVSVDIEIPDESEVTEAAPIGASPSPQPDTSPDPSSDFDGFILRGGDGMTGPYASIGLEVRGFCVYDLPDWVKTAELIEEGLDQTIVSIDRPDLEGTSTGQMGCTYGDVPETTLKDLESDPESLTLRLIGESQTEDVEITAAFRP